MISLNLTSESLVNRSKGWITLIEKFERPKRSFLLNMDCNILKLVVVLVINYNFHKPDVAGLKLSKVIVPPHKLVGESAQLQCPYDLERDRLYAVKWYKDNEEFFRYVPKYNPPTFHYKVDGIHVKANGSDSKAIVLQNLEMRTTGRFRCEVSAEGPSFASVQDEGNMTVISLPAEGPQIIGTIFEEYEAGDIIRFNCTSSASFPPARLFWYINDVPIKPSFVQAISPGKEFSATALATATSKSSLTLPLEEEHFKDGSAKIKCVASIFALFWQDVDEKVVNNVQGNALAFDLRSTFNSSAVIDGRAALVLVRGSSETSRGNKVILLTMAIGLLTYTNVFSKT